MLERALNEFHPTTLRYSDPGPLRSFKTSTPSSALGLRFVDFWRSLGAGGMRLGGGGGGVRVSGLGFKVEGLGGLGC